MIESMNLGNRRKRADSHVEGVRAQEGADQLDAALAEVRQEAKRLAHLSKNDSKYQELSERLAVRVHDISVDLMRSREFAEITELGRTVLEDFGVEQAARVSSATPAAAVAIAEACNLAAKRLDDTVFYTLKRALIVAAWKQGAEFGRGNDGAYYLSEMVTGVASFHDPYNEVQYFVENILGEKVPHWEHEWSGEPRHPDAFEIMESVATDGTLAEEYARRTLPPGAIEQRNRWMGKRT